jgi:hypothetical protein
MTNPIGWCDPQLREHHISEDDAIGQLRRALKADGIKPFEDVPILLGAIAGGASGHDVVWGRPASFAHGEDVIPGLGGPAAICTAPVELLKEDLTADARYGIYIPPILCASFAAAVSKAVDVLGVPPAGISSVAGVAFAHAQEGYGEPCLASATPRKPFSGRCCPLWSGGARALSPRIARPAPSLQAVTPRSVSSEGRCRQPFIAFRTPLEPGLDAATVVLKRKTHVGGCDLQCAESASHAFYSNRRSGCPIR